MAAAHLPGTPADRPVAVRRVPRLSRCSGVGRHILGRARRLLRAGSAGRPGKAPTRLASALANELRNNPDGQIQFGPDGKPMDSVSNIFCLIKDRSGKGLVLVADGGGTAVLRVDRKGKVSNFFIPPVIKTGASAGVPNNDPVPGTGCDAVPTGLAHGPRNTLYVCTVRLHADQRGSGRGPGEHAGRLLRHGEAGDLRAGRAHRCRGRLGGGNVYLSELQENAPEGDPPPGVDPSPVGRIVQITPNGRKTSAHVTMPAGLLIDNGVLYASAWSIAGIPHPTSLPPVRWSGSSIRRSLPPSTDRRSGSGLPGNAARRTVRRAALLYRWAYDQGVRGRSTGFPSTNTSSRS